MNQDKLTPAMRAALAENKAELYQVFVTGSSPSELQSVLNEFQTAQHAALARPAFVGDPRNEISMIAVVTKTGIAEISELDSVRKIAFTWDLDNRDGGLAVNDIQTASLNHASFGASSFAFVPESKMSRPINGQPSLA